MSVRPPYDGFVGTNRPIFGPWLALEERQPLLDLDTSERDASDHDLQYLLSCLAEARAQRYELVERPDELERRAPAPDYLLREEPSGRTIGVERTLLIREDLQQRKMYLAKYTAGMNLMGPNGESGFAEVDRAATAEQLRAAIARKVAKRQLAGVAADERILLLRNGLPGTPYLTFIKSPLRFSEVERGGIDHVFLIASNLLLQYW